MDFKYNVGQIVTAKFTTQFVNTSKEYFNRTVESKGVVMFDEKEQSFFVESIEELPVFNIMSNGKIGTQFARNHKQWYVQGKAKIKSKISDITLSF